MKLWSRFTPWDCCGLNCVTSLPQRSYTPCFPRSCHLSPRPPRVTVPPLEHKFCLLRTLPGQVGDTDEEEWLQHW
ncbi:uncharacterized protein LOC109456203 [Rhinolophus sinicus]|uniref:uncharacterized protein LOC109456203 n=1 Tax=Rhinolophus sinicus TaxID=89399 RepID=UPI003D79D3AA